MNQFVATNEIYGELAKIINGILTSLRIPLKCVKYFKSKCSFVFQELS